MKKIYLCLLMLTLVGVGTVTAQEKKDEAKTEKVKKDSPWTQKLPKKGTPEYDATLRASKRAMDSIVKHFRDISIDMSIDYVMNFADNLCEKFKYDPVIMDSIAESFYTIGNYDVLGEQRYSVLKKMHPEYTQVYLNEARLFHSMAWYYEDGEKDKLKIKKELLEKCKEKIDSAKILMPNSPEPYMLWVRLQAPYKHYRDTLKVASIDEELETLEKKIPDYPGFLETARYYELILSKKDKNFLLDAAEYYEKAGDRNELSAAHWNNFAILIWEYYKSFPKEDYGINIANKGLSIFPNYPPLLRAKLWNLGRYEKWDDVLEMAGSYFESTDTLQPSFNDYKYIANAYENKKRYSEAIDAYTKELEMVKDTTEMMNTIFDLVKCYNKTDQYDKSIDNFAKFESLRRSLGRPIEYAHYNELINAYIYQGADTTKADEDRIRSFEKADSICQLSAEVSPEYIALINDQRFWTIFVGGLSTTTKYPSWGEELVVLPEFLEGAERLYKSVENILTPTDNDYYFMMKGYYWALQHYNFKDDKENAYLMSEKMLSVDVPTIYELKKLSAKRKAEYEDWTNKATDINVGLADKYGKKKKKGGR